MLDVSLSGGLAESRRHTSQHMPGERRPTVDNPSRGTACKQISDNVTIIWRRPGSEDQTDSSFVTQNQPEPVLDFEASLVL